MFTSKTRHNHRDHHRRFRPHDKKNDASSSSSSFVVAAATMAVTAACFLTCVTTTPPSVAAFSTSSSSSARNGFLPGGGSVTLPNQLVKTGTTITSIRPNQKSTSTTILYGKLWDKLQIEEDEYPTPDDPLAWYVINCVAGVELELLRQCRETCVGMPSHDVAKFVVPTKRTMRSHGQRNVVDVRVMYPGYVFCKIRMCPKVYEPLQALSLTRSWVSGTQNRRGYKKLPPAPVALNEDEVEKFGLLESQMEKYESVHGLEGEGDTGEDLIEQYKGFEVEGMVKVLSGKHKGEDGIVRRLKDGKICVRMYTYGTTFDEWMDPEELRPLTDLEIMRGLSGPSAPVNQDEFDVSIGKPINRGRFDSERSGGGQGNRHLRQSLMSGQGGSSAGERRMRRQDRQSRGERGDRDLFGRSDEEAKREEENWRDYRERQRAQQREGRRGDSWGIKERSSWGGGDDNDDRAAYDVDSQWGRGDRGGRQDIRSGRQQRRDRRREADRQVEDDGVERALSGEGDWSDFASGSGGGGGSSSKEDDFFDSLMSELSDTLDGSSNSGSSSSYGGGASSSSSFGGGRQGGGGAPAQSDEDDFFDSLMSDIGGTVDATASSSAAAAGNTKQNNDEDDFFASLESELSDTLNSPSTGGTPSSSASKKTSSTSSSSSSGEDDFFASLEAELNESLESPMAGDKSSKKSNDDAVNDDDFFAMLEADLAAGDQKTNKGQQQQQQQQQHTSSSGGGGGGGGDDLFSEDDFFANLEAEVDFAANEPTSTAASAAATPTPKKKATGGSGGGGGGGEDLSKLTVPILKEKLKERGLKVSGKKADLIERLQAAGN